MKDRICGSRPWFLLLKNSTTSYTVIENGDDSPQEGDQNTFDGI